MKESESFLPLGSTLQDLFDFDVDNRSWYTFYLKKKDINLMEITLSSTPYSEVKVFGIRSLYEDMTIFPAGFEHTTEGVYNWLQSRFIPKNRRFVENLLSLLDHETNKLISLLTVTMGLSLTDDYWIVQKDRKELQWKSFNLYTNTFSETLALLAFTGNSNKIDGISSSPEFTTNGMLPKCWRRRDDGTIYLYKGGTSGSVNAGLEPYSEYLAAQVAEVLGIKHVPYTLEKWKGNLCSVCPIFTSEDISYVPMHLAYPNVRGTDLLKLADNEGFLEDLLGIVLLDAMILNSDRHFGNFGMMRNNLTGKFVGLAPAFDHGMSLLHQAWGNDLQDTSEYVYMRRYTMLDLSYRDIPTVLRTPLLSLFGDKIRRLLQFKFTPHTKYNLDSSRVKVIQYQVRFEASRMLN
jgi:hypothetical protein